MIGSAAFHGDVLEMSKTVFGIQVEDFVVIGLAVEKDEAAADLFIDVEYFVVGYAEYGRQMHRILRRRHGVVFADLTDEIADRFGVPEKHACQFLALADVE